MGFMLPYICMPVRQIPDGTKGFHFFMPIPLRRRLKIAAAMKDTDMTTMMVQAVTEYLDRLEKVKGK